MGINAFGEIKKKSTNEQNALKRCGKNMEPIWQKARNKFPDRHKCTEIKWHSFDNEINLVSKFNCRSVQRQREANHQPNAKQDVEQNNYPQQSTTHTRTHTHLSQEISKRTFCLNIVVLKLTFFNDSL